MLVHASVYVQKRQNVLEHFFKRGEERERIQDKEREPRQETSELKVQC